jgi:hypothetical protein
VDRDHFPAPGLHALLGALLATTGRPSRGRRRRVVLLTYLVSFAFLILLPTRGWLGRWSRMLLSTAPAAPG